MLGALALSSSPPDCVCVFVFLPRFLGMRSNCDDLEIPLKIKQGVYPVFKYIYSENKSFVVLFWIGEEDAKKKGWPNVVSAPSAAVEAANARNLD